MSIGGNRGELVGDVIVKCIHNPVLKRCLLWFTFGKVDFLHQTQDFDVELKPLFFWLSMSNLTLYWCPLLMIWAKMWAITQNYVYIFIHSMHWHAETLILSLILLGLFWEPSATHISHIECLGGTHSSNEQNSTL